MKFPSFRINPKSIKLPKWTNQSLVKIWRIFYRKIPRDFRSVIKTYHHFVVFGDKDSGKTQLIQGIIEQSQDIYPFEMFSQERPELQFYLGPKQIIQEVSPDVLNNRSIKFRKHLIRLWKRLFGARDLTAVITYNSWSEASRNTREASKQARQIIGKIALLSEIRKQPIKVRFVLTHMDQLEGYAEFARFLKQQNIVFELPITSNFANHTLKNLLTTFYEDHLSLMLTTVPARDFIRILTFFKELPSLFPRVEGYLRVLISREAASSPIVLESVCLSSEVDPNTSFPPFDWKRETPVSIFFRYPMLKHQVASLLIMLLGSSLILNNYFSDRHQLQQAREGSEILELLQPKSFVASMIPKLEPSRYNHLNYLYCSYLPKFFKQTWKREQAELAKHIRQKIFDPMLKKMLIADNAELKAIYLLGLMHSTNNNRLGRLISSHVDEWAKKLNIDKDLILTYVNYRGKKHERDQLPKNLSRINLGSPLIQLEPWSQFLDELFDTIQEPVLSEFKLKSIKHQAKKLYTVLKRADQNRLSFTVSNLLEEAEAFDELKEFNQQVETLKWIEENRDSFEHLLCLIEETSPQISDTKNMNVSQFFAQIKNILLLEEIENRSYSFACNGKVYRFDSKRWVDLVETHIIEEMIHNYIAQQSNSRGALFFGKTDSIPPIIVEHSNKTFPYLENNSEINGCFSRLAYEKNVRLTTEKLFEIIQSLPINEEEKIRFSNFLSNEVMSYATEYQNAYKKMYSACRMMPVQLEELKPILENLTTPHSSFENFLKLIHHHTEVFDIRSSSLKTIGEVNVFRFLSDLFTATEDHESFFQRYQKVIQSLLNDLELDASSSVSKQLTSAARMSLAIIEESPDSYINKVRSILNEAHVPQEEQEPFLAPINRMYDIGKRDLSLALNSEWKKTFQPQISQLCTQFPFNPKGQQVATKDQVYKILHPSGAFWKQIQDIYGAVLSFNGQEWSPLIVEGLDIEAEIYSSLNELHKLTTALWDSEGNPIPIDVRLKAVPFSDEVNRHSVAVLSTLLTGDELFRNYNQNPKWHTLKINWVEPTQSAIIVELLNKRTGIKTTRDLQVERSHWSFFELLRRGDSIGNNTWLWNLDSEIGVDSRQVAVTFEKNPFETLTFRRFE